MSESKTHTIRASEETISSFKSLCTQFQNVDEAVQALINAHELAQARGVLAGQETLVNDFQSHADSLVRSYIAVLDLTANTENRVRCEFRERLESKDKTIMELQTRLDEANQLAERTAQAMQDMEQRASEQDQASTEQMAALIERAELAERQRDQAERTAQAAEAARLATSETLDTLRSQLAAAQREADKSKLLADQLQVSEKRAIRAESELAAQKAASELAAERAVIAQEKAVLSERTKAAEQAMAAAQEIKNLYAEIVRLKDELRESTQNMGSPTDDDE